MNTFLRTLLLLLIVLVPTLIATSCDNDDDLNEIFQGKTWKITGATIKGQSINGDEVKSLYTQTGTYTLTFSGQTFAGTLAAGSALSGTWKANGGKHTIQFTITDAHDTESTRLSADIYDIITRATTYSGDANILSIRVDEHNFIRLSSTIH